MAFRYDSDDLGYDLEVVKSASEQNSRNSETRAFSEPEAGGVVYECQVPPAGTRPGTVDPTNANRVAVDSDNNPVNGAEAWVAIPVPPQGYSRVGASLLARNSTLADEDPNKTIRFNPITGQWPVPGAAPAPRDPGRVRSPAPPPPPPAPRAVDATHPPASPPPASAGYDQVGAPQRGTNSWVYFYRNHTNAHQFQKRTVPDHAASAADAPTAAVAVQESEVPAAIRTARPTPVNPGARHGGAARVAEAAAPRLDPNEERLRGILTQRGLSPKEVDAFMTRFPEGARRTAEMNRYLSPARTEPETSAYRLNNRSAAEIRTDVLTRARDNAVASARAVTGPNQPTPRQVYNNLVAHGIVQGGRPPAADATWTGTGEHAVDATQWQVADGNQPIRNADSLSSNALYTSRTASINGQELEQDTQRHILVDRARNDYVEYWTHNGGTPEHRPTREQAEERFNMIAHRVGMTNTDGSVRPGWDPRANTGPAQAFYPVTGENQRFATDEHGVTTVDTAHSPFQHEDVTQAADAAHPLPEGANAVTRAVRQGYEANLSRDQAYRMLTGQDFPGPGPHAPLPTEWSPMDPPLTHDEAIAYLQSRGLTDENGNPTSSSSPASFRSLAGDVRSGDISRSSALDATRVWERNEIARGLHAAPYNLSDTQITQYMLGQHMRDSNVSVADLDAFRRRVQDTRGDAANALRQEVLTDTHNRAPSGDEEISWARDTTEYLNQSRRGREDSTVEARRGRIQGSQEGEANRGTQRDTARTAANGQRDAARIGADGQRDAARTSADGQRDSARISAEGGKDQARISAASQERIADRNNRAQAEQGRLQRLHDKEQREEDRANQLVMSILTMLGQMASGAMQAGTSVGTASIQASQSAAYASSRGGQQPNIS